MASNCQIPTPQEYVIHMLDYIGYSKKLYGKRVLENSCGEGNILLEIVTRYIEKEHPVKWIQDDINRKAEKQKKKRRKETIIVQSIRKVNQTGNNPVRSR